MHEEENKSEIKEDISAIDALGHYLAGLAHEQVTLREPVERRWVEDIRQYQGKYTAEQMSKREQAINGVQDETSDIFINVTRHKTNAGEAIIGDLLFPGDQNNWSIEPTPVPFLLEDAQSEEPLELDGQQYQMDGKEEPVTKGDVASRAIEIAQERAENMSDEIDDQFVECRYNEHSRDAIHYAAMIGTGIMKGPIVQARSANKWQETDGVWESISIEEQTAAAKHVNPFLVYPDMQAATIDECEFIFEAAYPTKRQMQALANEPDIMTERLVMAIQTGAGKHVTRTTYQSELRSISGLQDIQDDNRYELWEYRGPLEHGVLKEVGLVDQNAEEDYLKTPVGVVWFCNGIVIRVTLLPETLDDMNYYFYSWERDQSSLFGYGVPYQMRQSQKVINVAWRQMLDNSSNTAGPQIVIDKEIIEPENSSWEIAPFKIWNKKRSSTANVRDAFAVFSFNNHQNEIANIYQLAQDIADNESGIPKLVQGQQGKIQTLGEATLQQDNANNDTRRRVREWDDNVTKPLLKQMYAWNMRYNPKNEIKGDFNIKAIGSTTLMEKAEKQNAIIQVARDLLPNPFFSPFIKTSKLLRELMESFGLDDEGIVRSDEEVRTIQEQQSEESGGGEGEMKAQIEQGKLQLKQQELQFAAQRLEMEERIELIKLAQHKEMTLEQLDAKLREVRLRSEVELHKFNTEVKLKQIAGEGI